MGLWSGLCTWFGFGPSVQAPAAPPRTLRESEYANQAWAPERESPTTQPAEPEGGTSVEGCAPITAAQWWQCHGDTIVEPPRLQMTDSADRSLYKEVQTFVENPNIDLPHLPHVPQRVLTLLRQPMINYVGIAQVISQDQTLSASLLRLANAACYAGTHQVSNLETALARLGMKNIQSMMLRESIKSITIKKTAEGRSTAELLWKKSAASAVIMEQLAYAFGERPDEAYLAGLLHDIGEMVLLRLVHDYHKIANQKVPRNVFVYLCQEYHEQIGGLLAEHWNLPASIQPLLRRHHGPIDQNDALRTQRCLLQITDMLVSLLGYGERLAYDLLHSPAATAIGFGADPKHLDTLNHLPEVVNIELNLPI